MDVLYTSRATLRRVKRTTNYSLQTTNSPYAFSVTLYSSLRPRARRICASSAGIAVKKRVMGAISVHCASSPIGVGSPVEPWCRARVLGAHQVRGGKTNTPVSDQPTGRASIVVSGQQVMVRELSVKGKPT